MKRVLFLAIVRKIWPYLLMVVLVGWVLYPGFDAFVQLANPFNRSTPNMATSHLPVHEVHFRAVDGVQLAGWLVIASPRAPTIILVHGSRGSRVDMLPWAQFLYDAGYNVLLRNTPLAGERQLYAQARAPKEQWIVPGGGHVGAIDTYYHEYTSHVLTFFTTFLKTT